MDDDVRKLVLATRAYIAIAAICLVTNTLRGCGACSAAAAAAVVESPQVPAAVNYAGLCSWPCEDGQRWTAVLWSESEAMLVRLTELDTETGLWIPDARPMLAPRGSSTAELRTCLDYGGPDEPFAAGGRWDPPCECCRVYDLDGDGDVDLRDVAMGQRKE